MNGEIVWVNVVWVLINIIVVGFLEGKIYIGIFICVGIVF